MKVNRSVALLQSLNAERQRWEQGSQVFHAQLASIVGDVLLSSAFLAYAGYYDQLIRVSLFHAWSEHLGQVNVIYRDLARIEVCYRF